MTDRPEIAFIGTGNMGAPLVHLLLEDKHQVTVWNRTASKLTPLLAAGARSAETPASAVKRADVVFSILGGDESIGEIFLGGGNVIGEMKPGAIHVGMSTISPNIGERLTQAHARQGIIYLGCPVFGRPEAAQARQLWLVPAGPQAAFQRVRPLLERLGRGMTYLGEDAAQAHLVKLAGNFLIAAAIEGMAEAFSLVERGGLDTERFLEVLNNVFRSPVYQIYGKFVAKGAPEPAAFAMRWGLKDLKLVRSTAEALSTPLPMADLIYQHLTASVARGRGEKDWTAVSEIAREMAGLPARVG
jgi:3-hydroxyisobutyrate dehydrogenase-like beta-hydroxyacid dehydrogenase